MKNVVEFFIKRPIWGNAIIGVVVLAGLFSLFNLKRSFFPEIDPYTITISVFYPGASPKEMEEGVTIKIEQAIKGLPQIEEINSVSSENIAMVTIKAYSDTDMDELLSDVENSVNSINSFPQGAERPIITKLKSMGMGSVVAFIGISSKTNDGTSIELIDMANKVERDLLNSKEITQIEKQGFPQKEIAINVREKDLLKYAISMQEISLAVAQKNMDITTGMIRGGVQELNVRSNDRSVKAEDLERITVRTSEKGDVVLLKDVADVRIGYDESSQESTFNGKKSVSFRIEKTPEQDIKKISETIHDYQKKFNEEHQDYQFDIYYEFNELLDQRIELLSKNGITGLVLVLVFLGLFLNIRLSAWVAFGIPFSFLGMFIMGSIYGMTINMISLFGMILVVGILVDDGIVIAENIFAQSEKGKSPMKAALDGTMEVLPSVFTSILTTVVAFGVLLFVEGLEMMREMAFVVIASLLFSLIEAFFILPAHLANKNVLSNEFQPKYAKWKGLILMLLGFLVLLIGSTLYDALENPGIGGVLLPFGLILSGAVLVFKSFKDSGLEATIRNGADKVIKYVRDIWFKEAVEFTLGKKRKWYLLSFFLPLIFVISTIAMLAKGVIGSTFFPAIQPDFFSIEVAYRPGDAKSKTDDFIAVAKEVLMQENQKIKEEFGDDLITYYSTTIGFTQNLGQNGNHTGSINVFFDGEKSDTPVDTLINRIIHRLKTVEEAQLAQEVYVGGFNRFGKEIEIGLTSANDKELGQSVKHLKSEINKIDGIINIKDNMPPGKMEIDIELLPQAEIYGLSKAEILNQIRAGFFGIESQRVLIGTDEVKIWVRYPPEDRKSIGDLEQMKIKNATGIAIALNEICSFTYNRAPESLKRRNGQRIIKIDANSTDPDQVANLNKKIFDDIIPAMKEDFPNVTSIKLGQFERSQKTGSSMQYIASFAIIMMFIIITLHFNSLSQAFLIMLVIPAGIAGAMLGHGLVGIPVSILSAFGMIALIGVLVNDSIVFLDRYNQLLLKGFSVREAALEAATSRFRPILLTSITTVAGLLPMISETSLQAQFLIPMATSIAFGILFGTIFILFFYPAAILFWNARGRLFLWVWKGQKATENQAEPVLIHKEKVQKKLSENG